MRRWCGGSRVTSTPSMTTRPELGHLKKADASAHRHLVEFRDQAGELQVGETVTVGAFEPGQKVKVSGVSKGKGFQGMMKRHNFAGGPVGHGTTTSARPARSVLRDAVARLQGYQAPGRMGGKRSPSAASRSSR